jgi:hypothetical protein
MSITINRLGDVQLGALDIYIFDACHEEDEFPGRVDSARLVVSDRSRAYDLLMDAVNSANEDNDPEMRDALARIASRVLAA